MNQLSRSRSIALVLAAAAAICFALLIPLVLELNAERSAMRHLVSLGISSDAPENGETSLSNGLLRLKRTTAVIFEDYNGNRNWSSSEFREALRELPHLPTLQLVDVAYCHLEDGDLPNISGLPALKSLDLSRTQITDKGIHQLLACPLQNLELYNTAVGDAGLESLCAIKSLESIDLRECAITDSGLSVLPALRNLHKLRVSGPAITNRGADFLARCSALTCLSLNETSITPIRARSLQEQLPSAILEYSAELTAEEKAGTCMLSFGGWSIDLHEPGPAEPTQWEILLSGRGEASRYQKANGVIMSYHYKAGHAELTYAEHTIRIRDFGCALQVCDGPWMEIEGATSLSCKTQHASPTSP